MAVMEREEGKGPGVATQQRVETEIRGGGGGATAKQ